MLAHSIILPEERLIVALDVPYAEQAREIVLQLGDAVKFYKLGLELFMTDGFWSLLEWLTAKQQKKVFVDLKFLDIPRTVGAAVANLSRYGVSLTTIHAAQPAMIEAAAHAKGDIRLLAVTVLTSMTEADFDDVGYQGGIDALVKKRAEKAMTHGADGIVCSVREAEAVRRVIGTGGLIVTPGIRAAGGNLGDQQRVADVPTALKQGADYLVIGRPILQAENRRQAAEAIQQQILAASA